MTRLPQGWTETALVDVCELLNGRAYSQPELLSEGKYPVLRVGNLFSRNAWYHSDLELDPDKYIDRGDLIYAWSASFGPRLWQGGKVIYHYHIWKCALKDQAVNKQFLYNLLLWDTSKIKGDHGVGSTMMHVTKSAMEKRKIPLPPLPEQQRIVRKLDTLSARSTTARTHLTAIEKLVERYKRLVIGQLCLGGVASQFQDQAELPELPQGWEWSRAEDLCHWITKGTTPSKDELFAGKGDVPFIKVYNLTFSERLDFSVDPSFVSAYTHNIALKRSKLFPGDVLINIVGPPLGKTAIVPIDFPEWNMNQAIAVFRPKERLFNRFLLYWLSSEWFLSWALSRSKATAGQRNLTLEICRDTPVPLPSFDEQRDIVRRIEAAFARIDRLAAEAAKSLKLLGHLDQRILSKAFAGELVPQDPTDEPAETLLARIREVRSAGPKQNRRRAAKSG